MWILSTTDGNVTLIPWIIVISGSIIAALCDLRTRRIPNILTFPLFLSGLVWSFVNGGLSGLGESFGTCVLLALPYIILFIFANGGAGDAKLMGAIGTWLGFKSGIIVLFCVAITGIILSILKAMSKKQTKDVLTSVFVNVYSFMLSLAGNRLGFTTLIETNESERMEVPYGVAILSGVLIAGVIIWLS